MNHYKRWVIYTAALFLLISATLVNTPNLYFMAALLLVLPVISYLLGMFALRDLEFDRETPASGWEGEVATFQAVVRSRARLPKLFLQAADALPDALVPVDQEVMFNAAPMSTTKIPYRVELTRRGAYKIEGMHVTALDPLGIYAFRHTYPVVSELLVYPTPQIIPAFALSGAERFGFQDLPIAATKGSGVDPDGVRQYVPGDPLRRMHWKSTARTGKLNVIEFEESHALNVVMALDLSRDSVVGEGRQSTLEYLVTAAASIAQLAIRQGASVRLVSGDSPDPADFAGRGSEHLFLVLSSLARAAADQPGSLGSRLVERVGPILPGTTLIVLTARPDEELPGALAHYTAAGIQSYVFYADPLSFQDLPKPAAEERQRQYMSSLLGAQAAVLLLRRNDERQIQPEPITDAIFHA
jgi:uncharacterized protein (DUF58 family)